MAKKKFNPKESAAEQQTKLLKDAQSIGKALGMEYGDIADIQEQIMQNQIKSNAALLESLKLAKQTADAYKQRARQEDDALRTQQELLKAKQKEIELEEKAKKLARDQAKQATNYKSTIEDLNEAVKASQKTIFSNTEETYNTQRKIVNQRKNEIKEAAELNEITEEQAEVLLRVLDALDRQIDSTQQLQDQYQGAYDTISGLGGFLKKNFGQVGEILEGSMNEGMAAFAEEMAASGDSALASRRAMEAFGGEITTGLAQMFSIVGIATLLLETLENASQQVSEFASATGASVAQSEELVNNAKQYAITSGLTLADAEKSLEVQKQLVAEFGNVNSISAETATKVAQIGESFGYGAELAGQVQASMMSIGASADDAMKIQGFTSALAEAAGVAPGAVMKDIAQNAKLTAKYFAGNPKALAKAAVEAARIGLSLQDMTTVADKLLDIESSLTSQFEASAMLGRTINMDKARQLALEGDIEGATKATLEQVGTLNEFNNMSMMQKKKIAEAAGLEVGQIEKALQLQEASKNMTDEQKAAIAKYGDALGDVSKMNEDEILQRTTALQSADEMNASIAQMKDLFTTSILPIAKVFGSILAGIAPIIKAILSPFILISKLIDYISEAVSGLSEKFSFISTIVNAVSWTFEKIGSILGGVIIPYLAVIIAKQVKSMYMSIAEAIPKIVGGFASLGPFGIPMAATVITGMIGLATSFMDDGVVQPGYGSRVLSTPEGSISLNNKDTVVAGTNLFDGNNGGSGNASTGKMESLLMELIALTKQSLAQPVPVVIGDKAINEIGKQYATNSTYKPAGSR